MRGIDERSRGRLLRVEESRIGRERCGKPKSDAFVFAGAEFASRLVQQGVDLYTVKELLGHSELAMTERYSHLAPDTLAGAVERRSSAETMSLKSYVSAGFPRRRPPQPRRAAGSSTG